MAPLLKSEDCCILLIDPVRRNLKRTEVEPASYDTLINRHALIFEAAKLLNVPKFFAIYGDTLDERDWIAQPCDGSNPRVFAVTNGRCLWFGSGVGAALAQEGRACLVLCGFWLEAGVTFAALNALADGFDVFVLMDACPSCDRYAQCPAVSRLLQAGVVPLTTTQMVNEWAEAASDDVRRSSLRNLLTSTS